MDSATRWQEFWLGRNYKVFLQESKPQNIKQNKNKICKKSKKRRQLKALGVSYKVVTENRVLKRFLVTILLCF